MTPDQRELLTDKAALWRRQSVEGNMDMRDYHRRCADAMDAALSGQSADGAEAMRKAAAKVARDYIEPDEDHWIGFTTDQIADQIEALPLPATPAQSRAVPDEPAPSERSSIGEVLEATAAALEQRVLHEFRGSTFPAAQIAYDAAMAPVYRARAALTSTDAVAKGVDHG